MALQIARPFGQRKAGLQSLKTPEDRFRNRVEDNSRQSLEWLPSHLGKVRINWLGFPRKFGAASHFVCESKARS